ncbi:hypothetical protein J4E89_010093 [Alternaria sp. Ai002NY15]|nr:hypothetical protein J4E89_010093 [Alternaria sp. Ai002NY15]
MAQSPSGGQVHADDSDGDALRVSPEAARSPAPDPYNPQVFWQILCLTKDLPRSRICSYLGFSTTVQMRTWEESDPVRWEHIRTLTSPSTVDCIIKCKVYDTNVMRTICNDGGAPANVVAYIESLKPWTACTDDDVDFKRNAIAVATISNHKIAPAQATLRFTMAVVWLIRKSAAQFRESGYFNTPYFWYAPEDVNRAHWYLTNLRYHPEDRLVELTKSAPPVRPVGKGKDAGLASLHNSVSEGEWAGRFLRKDIVANQEKIPEDQDQKTSSWGRYIGGKGEKTGQWRNKAEIRSEDIAAQLLRIRTWSYNTYTFSNPTNETELDRLMDLARLHTKPQTRNMDVYRSACMEVELFVWAKSHPHILDDRFKDTFADFKLLLSWLHARDIAVGDDEGVAGRMEEAVMAVVAADRGRYNGKKAEVKEMVYMADLGMGEVLAGC